jgi:LPXTG-motif cell wall-anchored protein
VGAGNPPAGSGGTGGTGGGNPRPGSGGTTPSTGLPGWLAVAGGLLLTAGALTGRRRRTA